MSTLYAKPVIVLIDEYDVPLAKAREQGYYPQMLDAIERVGIETGMEKGKAEGRAEGRAEGKAEGEAKLARLIQKLISLKRYEDLEKASVDVAFRTQLYNEFQMA